MITSYGSDESDSDTADENRSKNDTKESSVKSAIKTPKSRCSEKSSAPIPVMQPQLVPISQNLNQIYESKEETVIEPADSKPAEDTEIKYLKNQIKQDVVSQRTDCTDKANSDSRLIKESVPKKTSNKHSINTDVDFRISLVPGYDEDSDVEEESEEKQERKALFPIPQIAETTENVSSRKNTIDDDHLADSNDSSEINSERKSVQEQDNEDVLERLESKDDSSAKTEEDTQKGNKFVDNLHGRNKFFQRKKRIAFDGRKIL